MLWFRRKPSSNGKIYSAVDVGTTKVCTLIGSMEDDDYLRILGVGISRSKGMRKAVVIDLKEVGKSVRDSVKKAEADSGLRLTPAYIGITGGHVSSFNTRSTLAVPEGREVQTKELKRLVGHVHDMRMSRERELIHALPQMYRLDGQTGIKNPLGMHGLNLDADVHMVTVAANAVKNLVKSVRKAGVIPEDIVLEPLASGEAVLRPVEKDVGVVVVDIGGGTTDIAVYKNGNILHTAAIPVAGYQLTRDLAVGLNIAFETAEEFKVKHANLNSKTPVYPASEIPLKARDDKVVPYHKAMEILSARVEELLKLIWVELSGENLSKLAPAGVVLTGGTSKLPGIAEMAREVFNVPCRVGVPRNISGMVQHLHDPAFATSVGLLFWGVKYAKQELKKHHNPSPLMRLWLGVTRRWRGTVW